MRYKKGNNTAMTLISMHLKEIYERKRDVMQYSRN